MRAFSDIPEMVRPYIFMYGPNEVTYYQPVVRVLTVHVIQASNGLEVTCCSLSGEATKIEECEPSQTVGGLNGTLRDVLGLSLEVDLQLVTVEGTHLADSMTLGELCVSKSM